MLTLAHSLRLALTLLPMAVLVPWPIAHAASSSPVYFPSGDGRTEIVGYLFKPDGPGPFPAVVMLHGRAGPYSSNVSASCTFVQRGASSACSAATQSKRSQMWGEFWAQRGVMAIHVDSFGPRGKGHGFGRNSHDDPDRDSVNELTVRPLDAEGALAYLRTRPDVIGNRITVQGWSNGGSTTLNVMYRQATGQSVQHGFRAALVFYPGCGPKAVLSRQYQSGAPTVVFLGADDEEVNPQTCRKLLTDAPAGDSNRVHVVWYDGATHDFDDPGKSRQSVAGNQHAKPDSMRISEEFFGKAFAR